MMYFFFFFLSSCYFFPLRFKYFPRTLFSNSLSLNHVRNGLYKWTLCEHHFLVLLLHQSSLELMKIKKEQILFHFLFILPNQTHLNLPMVSPVSSSSPTSTQRIENGGSKCAKPSRGGLEQLVTNYNNSKTAAVNLLHLRKQNFKKSAKYSSWMTEQQPIQSQLKMFIIYVQLGYNMLRLE